MSVLLLVVYTRPMCNCRHIRKAATLKVTANDVYQLIQFPILQAVLRGHFNGFCYGQILASFVQAEVDETIPFLGVAQRVIPWDEKVFS